MPKSNMANAITESTVTCPACGGENESRAVFCANPSCHKALGEFRYAIEELGRETKWHLALMSQASDFIGRPHFVGLHFLWFALWIAINSGLIAMSAKFDAYPFGLLGLMLGIESVLITSILIIGNRSAARLADKRAELDYEVNVQTYREIRDISLALDDISRRLEAIERR